MTGAGRCVAILAALLAPFAPTPAAAWGNVGHKVIALVGDHFLNPQVRAKIDEILSADGDNLAAHDIAGEAIWADRYRDSDRGGSQERYRGTREWHYVNIEIDDPDLDRACFGHPSLPGGVHQCDRVLVSANGGRPRARQGQIDLVKGHPERRVDSVPQRPCTAIPGGSPRELSPANWNIRTWRTSRLVPIACGQHSR